MPDPPTPPAAPDPDAGVLALCEQLEVLPAHALEVRLHPDTSRDLAACLRRLLAERDQARAAIPWDRTPGLPPVPVSQGRYDAVCLRREELDHEAFTLSEEAARLRRELAVEREQHAREFADERRAWLSIHADLHRKLAEASAR